MSKILFTEAGDEVEVKTDEELKEMEDKITELDDLKTKHGELTTKLAGLESKDFNFRKFEQASEEEKAKLTEKMTEIEKASVQEIANLTAKIEENEKISHDGMKEKAIKALAGEDEEFKKELETAYEKSLEFGGKAKSPEDVALRMQEAYRYIKGTAPNVNALNAFVPNTPVVEDKSKRFTDSDKGKSMLQENFPNLYPKDKE